MPTCIASLHDPNRPLCNPHGGPEHRGLMPSHADLKGDPSIQAGTVCPECLRIKACIDRDKARAEARMAVQAEAAARHREIYGAPPPADPENREAIG